MKNSQRIFVYVTAIFLCVIFGVFIGRRSAKVYIPLDNPTADTAENTVPSNDAGKIDLNTATLQQLQLLPGVGQTIAQRILDYRESAGRFDNIEQIMDVKGIGENTFEAMKSYIKVEAAYEDSGS
ncbi:MAG: helix-hairpin-helix domain-containing protein [Oscillospiraceae bacterium]|nr:helix-hairpin-helix domain-containing protein [Oscillospiraceae bacterium]